MDVVVLLHASDTALHPVGVKDQDDMALLMGLIVTEIVHQRLSRPIHAVLGEFSQFLPGEDDIIPVHQQVFLHRLVVLDGHLVCQLGVFCR